MQCTNVTDRCGQIASPWQRPGTYTAYCAARKTDKLLKDNNQSVANSVSKN